MFEPYRKYISADQVEIDGIIQFSCKEDREDLKQHVRGHFDSNIFLCSFELIKKAPKPNKAAFSAMREPSICFVLASSDTLC